MIDLLKLKRLLNNNNKMDHSGFYNALHKLILPSATNTKYRLTLFFSSLMLMFIILMIQLSNVSLLKVNILK